MMPRAARPAANCSPELGVDRHDGWPAEIGEYWNSGRTRVSGHWAS